MKTKEELNALKEEVVTLNKKLAELTEEELRQVTGGMTDGHDCTFSGNTGMSVGAILTPSQQDKPAQEGGEEQGFRPMNPESDPRAYRPSFQVTDHGEIKFYNDLKK